MKKLIVGLCATLVLASCGNDAEKKANERLTTARTAFEQGDYNEAKLQIDSIKILYPKAFDARREGISLMLAPASVVRESIFPSFTAAV